MIFLILGKSVLKEPCTPAAVEAQSNNLFFIAGANALTKVKPYALSWRQLALDAFSNSIIDVLCQLACYLCALIQPVC